MHIFTRLFKRTQEPPRRVAVRNGNVVTEVGPGTVLHALFSTIASNLEPSGWGTRFPLTMNHLYRGRLEATEAAECLIELRTIEKELRALPTSAVVWDFDRPTEPVSRFYTLGADASNAADYFVTVNGLNLVRDALIESVESAVEFKDAVEIITFGSPADFFRDGS